MTRDIFGNVARVRGIAQQRIFFFYRPETYCPRTVAEHRKWIRVRDALAAWQRRAGVYQHPELLRACPKATP